MKSSEMSEALQIPRLGASACVWKEGNVLLVRRAKPPYLWAFPGGSVEFGETAQSAAARELLEETGVRADLSAFVGLYEIILPESRFHFAVACYAGLWVSGDPVAASDASEARWLAPEEIGRFDLAPRTAEALADSLRLLGR